MPLNRRDIAALIPHSGAMCLLDEIVAWDAASIRGASRRHRDADNPLRSAGRLHSLSAIEYAAQAMAAHGALVGAVAGRPRVGFLVSLRSVACRAATLDELEGELEVTAQHVAGDAERVMYAFSVRVGTFEVLNGKATVVLDAEMPQR